MSETYMGRFGYFRDLPDIRDYHAATASVAKILKESKPLKGLTTLPPSVDLRAWCSPIEDQGNLGSCTANAGVGVLEYFERRAFGKYLDASRLFLYKTERDLLGWHGDTGGFLRTTMEVMVLFGVPPESYWPYVVANYDIEPSSFLYALADNYKAYSYYRLDPAVTPKAQALTNVKTYLAAGLVCMFGFTVYASFPSVGSGKIDIPYPAPGEKVLGGHAVDAVGYDDNRVIGGHKGALLIRNSWGINWGDKGYGWLPYDYVLNGLANDFWTLVHALFVDTDLFK